MRITYLVSVVATLALAAGCGPKDAPDEDGGSSRTLQGRSKAQTTATLTATETTTATHTSTATATATQTITITQTTINTNSGTGTATFTVTQTRTATATGTVAQTVTITATGTRAQTSTATQTGTAPGTYEQIYTFSGTVTSTGTAIAYYASWPHSQGNTATATTNQFASGTGIATVTRTVTSPFVGTETKTTSATVTGSGTSTGTATVTVTATVTTSSTNAGTGTGSVTATGTATGTATQTWTATWTVQVTRTATNTATSTVTNTNTVTNTLTTTGTSTLTQTSTQTGTTSNTSTNSGTSTTTSTGTKTNTTTNTGTDTVTSTVTLTTTSTDTSTSVDGGTVGGCLENWRNTTCGEWCKRETQDDRKHCVDFLDCYLDNGVGPTDNPDGTCGVNNQTHGMAPKTIADQVYQCLGCPGTTPVTSCVNLPDTTPCTDGNRCTDGDMCVGNACRPGAPVTCPGDQCNDGGACNPATGVCSKTPKADGTTCNDGNACTKNDACSAGTCSGVSYTCNDGLSCTQDTCNGDGTCTFTPNAGGCVIDGACYAAQATNPANQCQTCLPDASQTAWQAKSDGTECNDGNACTKNDACSAGTCSGTAYTCDDGLSCTSDACNGDGTCTFARDSGSCVIDNACYGAGDANPANECQTCNPDQPTIWSNQADGTSCNDGNDQTQGDACTMGICQGTQACSPVGNVATGGSHTCTVRNDGSLWCWGANGSGQLGTGGTDASSVPVRAGASTWRWRAVAAGESFTCAIRSDTTLWCWGDNSSGQLGYNRTASSTSPVEAMGASWVAVEAGQQHACALRSNNALWCWGDNSHGQLGDGTYESHGSPIPVSGAGWVSVTAGSGYTCGLKGDHSVWCWGQNADGRLGNGSTEDSPLPVQANGTDWSGVTAGNSHTCGVKLDGSLWCWGGNDSGQLGTGSTAGQASPTQVGTATWTTVSAGAAYTCGVQTGGALWCWGANDGQQLGDGTSDSRLSPVRIPGQAWADVSAGADHTCGRREDGSLWCWGNNQDGEVGDGTSGNTQPPEQIVGSLCSQVPICGNGVVEDGEECDDGNNSDTDGCSFDCKVEKCYGVVCEGSDQCHGVCNPATGECSDDAKPDGTRCDDGDACTQRDKCYQGECQGGDEVVCPPPDKPDCQSAGVCDSNTGTCSYAPIDKVGCNITLRYDGFVDMGDGNYIALFGHNSSTTSNYHPKDNTVSYDPQDPSTPQATPPYDLTPGDHPGSFMPTFRAGHTVTWTVDEIPVSADATDLTMKKTPTAIGTGQGVDLGGGVIVMVTPDLSSYLATPSDPAPQPQPEPPTQYGYAGALTGTLSTSPTGAAIYTVPIAIPPGIAGMAPNLNLVYNSQSGPGIAGEGWDLTGLSYIYRCPKTMPQDGYSQPVRMDGTPVTSTNGDGICLDGKRLYPRNVSNYGTVFDSEFADFSDVHWIGEEIRVTLKSGEIRHYGSRAQSLVRLPQEDASGAKSSTDRVTAIWALDKVEDSWGNYYTIQYNDDATDFEDRGLLVTKIEYTGHPESSDGAQDGLSPFAAITFQYDQNSITPRLLRFRDSVIPKKKFLTRINTPRGDYVLDYSSTYNDRFFAPFSADQLYSISFAPPGDPDGCLGGSAYAYPPFRIPGPQKCVEPLDPFMGAHKGG